SAFGTNPAKNFPLATRPSAFARMKIGVRNFSQRYWPRHLPANNNSWFQPLTYWYGACMVFLSVIIPRHISFLLALLLATVTAGAQTTAVTEQSETVKALLTRIDKLEQRVAELEAGKNAASTLQPNGQSQGSQIPKAEL